MLRDYVLFDLDGTLLDSLPLIEAAFYHVFKQMNIPWENGAVMKTVGLPLRDACRQFAGERWQELFNNYINHQLTLHDQYIKVYKGALETLDEIKPLVQGMGVVTSKRRPMAERGIDVTGLNRYLKHLVALEDVEKPKPHGEPVLRGLGKLGASPEQAVFVGDSYYDIESGRNAGVITVGVSWGMASREELQACGPDFIADTWPELAAILKGL
ncbi:HAD-IA family hydrolase [Desulfoscipio gibsoniae]|uniref:Haloacid dehalogenase superfamily protein, subfamily IA, variant 3 with third motif having DD or ED n=1 Tax=Desulfoscipio gibsoniae DSM 7213 TaxID=767817 RepID=R4KIM5_9FIRM|nr:HAD-IA family hydrolase [Desulfoscipio gibsoniae]AGL03033.1 haloacid dehalogenase superfamily protein, subfamily IA, variant 3 with third motif having DD or ED [Desulfoscipio gibsoniae DSM 7213]